MINPTQLEESFGGLTQDLVTVSVTRDASNALAPRDDSGTAARPSARGCSPRSAMLSDAGNALAPRTAFASAACNFADGYFDDAVAAGVLASRVASSVASRGIGRLWLPTTGAIVCGRTHLSQEYNLGATASGANRTTWRARRTTSLPTPLVPAADAAGADTGTAKSSSACLN